MLTNFDGSVVKGSAAMRKAVNGNDFLVFNVSTSRNGFKDSVAEQLGLESYNNDIVSVKMFDSRTIANLLKSVGGLDKLNEGGYILTLTGYLTLNSKVELLTRFTPKETQILFQIYDKGWFNCNKTDNNGNATFLNYLKKDKLPDGSEVLNLVHTTKVLSMNALGFENHYDGQTVTRRNSNLGDNFATTLNQRKHTQGQYIPPKETTAPTRPVNTTFDSFDDPEEQQNKKDVVYFEKNDERFDNF